MPAFYVLDFVEQEVIEIAVDLVEYLQYIVKLVGLEIDQTLVVKIGIGIFDSYALQGLIAEGGLSASSYANDNLS